MEPAAVTLGPHVVLRLLDLFTELLAWTRSYEATFDLVPALASAAKA